MFFGLNIKIFGVVISFDNVVECAVRNSMHLNEANSQYMRFKPNTPPTLLFSNSAGGTAFLSDVHWIKGLGVIVNCLLSVSPYIVAAVLLARGMLAIIRRTFRGLSLRFFLPCTPQ